MTPEDPTKIMVPGGEDHDEDDDMADMKMALEMRQANMASAGFSTEAVAAADKQGEYAKKIVEINQRMESGEISDEAGALEIVKARREMMGI